MWKIALSAVGAAVAVFAMSRVLPDVKRYLHIRSM
ncbi:DUF6893 family small protein [Actinacidiphila glaucinigra]